MLVEVSKLHCLLTPLTPLRGRALLGRLSSRCEFVSHEADTASHNKHAHMHFKPAVCECATVYTYAGRWRHAKVLAASRHLVADSGV